MLNIANYFKRISDKLVLGLQNMKKNKREASPFSQEIPLKKEHIDCSEISLKRRQCAILIMYSGFGYFGMHRQPNHPTIENELLDALLKAKLITEENHKFPGQIRFQRASKTDRSVSAIGQVVSGRFNEAVEDPAKILNSYLPQQIRIIDFMRVTRGFNAKNSCSHRIYQYIMPTFALASESFNLNESTSLNYRIDIDTLQKFLQILENFKGTHNFYNFTSGRHANSKSCARYIMDMKCSKPLLYDCNLEYIVIDIIGQSFMLHQIRKMIGLSIAICRGNCDESVWDRCFTKTRIDIPRAPALGLLLDKVIYDQYNKRYGHDGIHQTLDWYRYKDQMDDFKQKFVLEHMIKQELETSSMFNWLWSLSLHTFDERQQGSNSPLSLNSEAVSECPQEFQNSNIEQQLNSQSSFS